MSSNEIASRLSRRALLKTGVIGVAVVAIGSIGLTLQSTRLRKPPTLKVLDAKEYAVLAAIGDRLCPAMGPGAPGASALDVAGQIDGLLKQADSDAQKGIKLALNVFESGLAGALLLERARPFTQLSEAEQDRVLENWRGSKVGFRRTVFRALSSLTMAVYYGDDRTWERIGYPGPPSPSGLRAAYADNLVDLASLRANQEPEGT